MTRRLQPLALAVTICFAFLTGCPRHWVINIYNHSGEDLAVLYPGADEVRWRHGSSLRLEAGREQVGWEAMGDNAGERVRILTIRRNDQAVKYRLALRLPPQYVRNHRGTNEFFLQLEPDAAIYAVTQHSPQPALALSPQPPGFPILPALEAQQY